MFFGLYDPTTSSFRALFDQRERAEQFPDRRDEEIAGRVLFKVRIEPVEDHQPGFWCHYNPSTRHHSALFRSLKDSEAYPLGSGEIRCRCRFQVELVHESENRFPVLQTVVSRKHFEDPLS